MFSNYVDEDSVLQLVSECADMLESVAVNETHTPALYASFIRALLAARQEQSVKSGNCTPYRYADGSRAASPAAAGMQAPDGLASRDPNDVQPGADGTANPADMHGMSATFSSDSITGIGMTASAAAAFGLPSDDANAGENGAGGSGGGGLEGASAFGMGPNGVNVDQLLTTSFWDSLLPPGFGGPLDGLSGSVDMHPSTYSMPGFSNHAHGEGSGTGGEGAEGGNGAGEGAGGNGAGSAHAHGHGHGHGHAHGHGMSLTPGATRAPSPQLMQSSFSGLDFSFPSGVLQP